MNELLTLSVTALARRIGERAVTSREVVEAHIARIKAVNSSLNAVVCARFSEARTEADAADERVHREGPEGLPPLHGVPCTIKENIALAGMPNSCGVVARKNVVAYQDAPSVMRLRAAGAIPLGVTNVAELTAWTASVNRVYGRTCNAYDPARSAGGSSGGEGAIVGAGGSPFGLGTDVGGSIRIPSFCNGVFGHKPTGGLVPSSGQFPSYQGTQRRVNTTGPIARRAEDLMPLLRVLAGPHPTDPQCRALELGEPTTVQMGKLRVLLVTSDGARPLVSPELTAAMDRAAAVLGGQGARVEHRGFARLASGMVAYLGRLLEDGYWPFTIDFRSSRWPTASAILEPIRLALGRSEHILPVVATNVLVRPALRLPKLIQRQAEATRLLRAEIECALGDDGVMLYPIATDVAPLHGKEDFRQFRFAPIFNALEMPVTHVPLGLGDQGLPLGIQVIAPRGQDHRTIAVALALERACGGWIPPA
ncbi:MAG: amidase [Mycobacterium sp.]